MRAEVLIVGGGLAGSAAAIALARAGRNVVLVEREACAQHKVCGEFLSREALAYLRALEVDVVALGAVSIDRVRVAGASEARLPFVGMSVTRRALDEALLRQAVESGARVMRGQPVESIVGGTAKLEGGQAVEADAVMMASGKHDVRGWPRPAGKQNDLVAFKMYWRLTLEQTAQVAGCVELVLYRGGYAGLQPVEDGLANLCCLVERRELQRLGGGWKGLLEAMLAQSAQLAERLQGAEPMLDRALAVAAIPYGFVREHTDGMWWLGDQAAVIPSFTGDGMSIALHTAKMAAQMYLRGETPETYQRTMCAQLSRQVREATMLSRSMVARPGVMAALARLWPGALGVIAERTRIPSDFVHA